MVIKKTMQNVQYILLIYIDLYWFIKSNYLPHNGTRTKDHQWQHTKTFSNIENCPCCGFFSLSHSTPLHTFVSSHTHSLIVDLFPAHTNTYSLNGGNHIEFSFSIRSNFPSISHTVRLSRICFTWMFLVFPFLFLFFPPHSAC